jgi:hypothetical protein
MGNARKVSKRIRTLRRKYLSVDGEYGNLGLFAAHKIVSECAESIETHSENTRKEFIVPKEDAKRLLAYSPNTPRDIKVCISPLIIIQI